MVPEIPASMQKEELVQETSSSTDQLAPLGLPAWTVLNPLAPPVETNCVGYAGLVKYSPTATQIGM